MPNHSLAKDKIIVALDVPTANDAYQLIDTLGDHVGFYKVGMQLFTACGPDIIARVKASGARIFLDLKFHDIPNTVKSAVASASALGVDMLTIHLCGGEEMIRAAIAGKGDADTLILGVSVLTSSNQETLASVGIDSDVESQVLRLAGLAATTGLGGVVASPKELVPLRQAYGDSIQIVTPGIRPQWAAANDQKRILTPHDALAAGANYLVIGRPITANDDPLAAAQRIAEECG